MAVVCSEIGEDFPLQGIQDHLFDSGDENEEEEACECVMILVFFNQIILPDVETTFEVTPRNHNLPFSSITISHCTSSSVDLVGLQVPVLKINSRASHGRGTKGIWGDQSL